MLMSMLFAKILLRHCKVVIKYLTFHVKYVNDIPFFTTESKMHKI